MVLSKKLPEFAVEVVAKDQSEKVTGLPGSKVEPAAVAPMEAAEVGPVVQVVEVNGFLLTVLEMAKAERCPSDRSPHSTPAARE